MTERRIVVPGEKIADGAIRIPGSYSDGTATYATLVGFIDEDRYIPLESRYKPMPEDVVVGMITDSRHAGYSVDLALPREGFISSRAVRMPLELGDFVVARVRLIERSGMVEFGEVRRLPKGKIVEFPSAKIPRLIGKKSSMLDLLRNNAGGDIVVGNNGYVWMSEKCNIPLLLKAIDIIKTKAHKPGLTDTIMKFFGVTGPVPSAAAPSTNV
jgi:exosome complex component RRP4